MALPMREKYSEMFSAITDTAKKIGRSLGPRRSPKAVDTAQYGGLAEGVKNNLPRTIPTSIESVGRISVPFMGSTKFEPGGTHKGIDIANVTGTPIPSWTRGRVSEVVTGKKWKDPAFGNYVKIIDTQGNVHRYSHLSENYVSVGDPVYRGMPIGTMGKTGQTYSARGASGDPSHLDWRILSPSGKFLDPMQFVQTYQKLFK